jgi:uncharacterized protein YbjT (DUF2867 family)
MLGRPVCRRLTRDGFRVRALARRPAQAARLLPKEVEVVEGDLRAVESIDRALQDCQAVYVTVDTPPRAVFRPETDGLRNVIAAAKNHPGIRLLVLSALHGSDAKAPAHSWWHLREKFEAQQIAFKSGLSWTIFEPTWLMESLPLSIKGRILIRVQTPPFGVHWVAGDDLGRFVSSALTKDIGHNEIVPVQGAERMSWRTGAERFIKAYDPGIRMVTIPLWSLRLGGLAVPMAGDLAKLLDLTVEMPEPEPDRTLWERFCRPEMTIEAYARYVKETGDFPQK